MYTKMFLIGILLIISGGALIVQEAGGKLSDFDGGNDYLFGKSIVATNGQLHKDFLGIVKKYFKGNS
jgi:myo-inositol-1(or 4)-monophosphatase